MQVNAMSNAAMQAYQSNTVKPQQVANPTNTLQADKVTFSADAMNMSEPSIERVGGGVILPPEKKTDK